MKAKRRISTTEVQYTQGEELQAELQAVQEAYSHLFSIKSLIIEMQKAVFSFMQGAPAFLRSAPPFAGSRLSTATSSNIYPPPDVNRAGASTTCMETNLYLLEVQGMRSHFHVLSVARYTRPFAKMRHIQLTFSMCVAYLEQILCRQHDKCLCFLSLMTSAIMHRVVRPNSFASPRLLALQAIKVQFVLLYANQKPTHCRPRYCRPV